jgi:phage gpG-like protein
MADDIQKETAAKLFAAMNAYARKVSDLRPIMDDLAEIGLSSIMRNFEAGGRYGSGEFGGGSERWIPSRAAEERDGQTLLDEGILANSVDYWIEGNVLIFGSNEPQARRLFEGDDDVNEEGDLLYPPRPAIVLQDEDIDEMMFVITDYASGLVVR